MALLEVNDIHTYYGAIHALKGISVEVDEGEIVTLIGERAGYVRAAAKFKTSAADVRAAERFAAMLRQRRTWAEERGLDPDMIEKLYRDMVNHFIQQEMAHWKRER